MLNWLINWLTCTYISLKWDRNAQMWRASIKHGVFGKMVVAVFATHLEALYWIQEQNGQS